MSQTTHQRRRRIETPKICLISAVGLLDCYPQFQLKPVFTTVLSVSWRRDYWFGSRWTYSNSWRHCIIVPRLLSFVAVVSTWWSFECGWPLCVVVGSSSRFWLGSFKPPTTAKVYKNHPVSFFSLVQSSASAPMELRFKAYPATNCYSGEIKYRSLKMHFLSLDLASGDCRLMFGLVVSWWAAWLWFRLNRILLHGLRFLAAILMIEVAQIASETRSFDN